MATLATIKKSCVFTQNLPADPAVPTPKIAEQNIAMTNQPRQVRGALYTYVKPKSSSASRLLATSPACFETIGLDHQEADTSEFAALVSGNKIFEESYPWAQCYGGYQFGQWASQLGDGRAISLGEVQAPGKERFELQLKGAGKTPYSRFADGNAVLRSSIREFLISEHLHALGIPTTRALALTLLTDRQALRERIEPCAIVARAAQSWIRFGTFDLLRRRGDRASLKKLADFCIDHVYGGDDSILRELKLAAPKGNRYEMLYRIITHRTATLVGKLQSYGFMNGVLNTDNTSIIGLSMDYGPFAFMDTFDPAYTPNHDDGQLRYSYRMQPTIFWWNLTRLGEALGELFGAGSEVADLFDDQDFLHGTIEDTKLDPVLTNAERIIGEMAVEYREVFMGSYKDVMSRRFGLTLDAEEDFGLLTEALTLMETYELDYSRFFYNLSGTDLTGRALVAENGGNFGGMGEDHAVSDVDNFLTKYKKRLHDQGRSIDQERTAIMKQHNPAFVLRSWILDEAIQRVQEKDDIDFLKSLLDLCTDPFTSKDTPEARRFCGPVPKGTISGANTQCSCSS